MEELLGELKGGWGRKKLVWIQQPQTRVATPSSRRLQTQVGGL